MGQEGLKGLGREQGEEGVWEEQLTLTSFENAVWKPSIVESRFQNHIHILKEFTPVTLYRVTTLLPNFPLSSQKCFWSVFLYTLRGNINLFYFQTLTFLDFIDHIFVFYAWFILLNTMSTQVHQVIVLSGMTIGMSLKLYHTSHQQGTEGDLIKQWRK